jgi:hypothetical protein
MPRSISEELKAHFAEDVTTIAICWKIERKDGTVMGFTNHDEIIIYEGVSYSPFSSADISNMEQMGGTGVDNLDIAIAFDDSYITRSDVERGRYDFAEIFVFLINYNDTSMGILMLLSGTLGKAGMDEYDATIEMNSLSDKLQNRIGRKYGYKCDAEFGSTRCFIGWPITAVDLGSNWIAIDGDMTALFAATDRLVISDSTGNDGEYTVSSDSYNSGEDRTEIILDETLPSDVADGRINGYEKLRQSGSATSVTSKSVFSDSTRSEADDYWKYGVLTFTSGNNNGFSREVKDFSSGEITLFLPMPYDIEAGDTYYIYPGCDKDPDTCKNTYDNFINFQGFPHLPGRDEVSQYADIIK